MRLTKAEMAIWTQCTAPSYMQTNCVRNLKTHFQISAWKGEVERFCSGRNLVSHLLKAGLKMQTVVFMLNKTMLQEQSKKNQSLFSFDWTLLHLLTKITHVFLNIVFRSWIFFLLSISVYYILFRKSWHHLNSTYCFTEFRIYTNSRSIALLFFCLFSLSLCLKNLSCVCRTLVSGQFVPKAQSVTLVLIIKGLNLSFFFFFLDWTRDESNQCHVRYQCIFILKAS